MANNKSNGRPHSTRLRFSTYMFDVLAMSSDVYVYNYRTHSEMSNNECQSSCQDTSMPLVHPYIYRSAVAAVYCGLLFGFLNEA